MSKRRTPTGESLLRRASAYGKMAKTTLRVSSEVLDSLPRVGAIPQWTCLIIAIGYPSRARPEINLRVG